MKKIVKISGVLSWINLIMGGILVAGGLLATVVSPSAFTVLFSVILPGSIILHSYAALQLRKSINYPTLPLNAQTPVGIRMMGYMALFFGIMSIGNTGAFMQQVPEAARQFKLQLPAQAKNIDVVTLLRAAGIFTILLSLCIITNVVLNLRLLRWYLFYRDKEKAEKKF